jgi:hypothetical protein
VARFRTHYDNLKVSRDAPVEVIHAAFKTLAAKYQPRVTAGDAEAVRIAMIVSRSYAVLSDPAQRAEHDRWIAAQEPHPTPYPPHRPENPDPLLQRQWFQVVVGVGILGFVGVLLVVFSNSPTSSSTAPPTATAPASLPSPPDAPAPPPEPKIRAPEPPVIYRTIPIDRPPVVAVAPTYTRPTLAPNGQPWPTVSSYFLDQIEDGTTDVTVDNTLNKSDMVVELFDLGVQPPMDVRIIFLRARDRFTMKSVRAGKYDIRNLDLDSGLITKSEQHNLADNETARLTLYPTFDGREKSTVIRSNEFDFSFLSGLPPR